MKGIEVMNLVSLMSDQFNGKGSGRKSLSRWRTLRASVDQLRISLYAARAGSWACDLTTGESYFSDELSDALGLRSSHDRGVHWLERIHSEDRFQARSDLQRAITERRDFESEFRVIRPDGSYCWMQSRCWILYDRAGRPQQMIGLGFEINARKDREKESADRLEIETSARIAAEERGRAQSELLPLVAHELRSTLNGILGWGHILTSEPFNTETAQKAGAIIERSVKIQERLIDDLVDLTRLRNNDLRIERQSVDLSKVINAALDIARPAAESKGVELRSQLASKEVIIQGDPARLSQIFRNLIFNAIKFTPRGGYVEMELSLDRRQVLILLRDSGIGIAPDRLPCIIDRFSEASSNVSNGSGRDRDLGMGLAIARELVRLHGGTIEAESPGENQGATFTVRLPYRFTSTVENNELSKDDCYEISC